MTSSIVSLASGLALIFSSMACAQNLVPINLDSIFGPKVTDDIVPGEYEVCFVGSNANSHKHIPNPTKFQGEHLRKYDTIEVTKQKSFGRLVLAKGDVDRETELLMIGDNDGKALLGNGIFRHRNEANNKVERVEHLVVVTFVNQDNIDPATVSDDGCKGTSNRVEITFCWERKELPPSSSLSGWLCTGEDTHLGHVHAEQN